MTENSNQKLNFQTFWPLDNISMTQRRTSMLLWCSSIWQRIMSTRWAWFVKYHLIFVLPKWSRIMKTTMVADAEYWFHWLEFLTWKKLIKLVISYNNEKITIFVQWSQVRSTDSIDSGFHSLSIGRASPSSSTQRFASHAFHFHQCLCLCLCLSIGRPSTGGIQKFASNAFHL